MKVEMLRAEISNQKKSLASLYQAKICLMNAEGFLITDEVEQVLDENLIYELRKSIRNVIDGISISMRIADR
jgi:hypothetical protein